LAEKYEVFTEEWDGKQEKVSRFVNPFFTEEAASKIEETDSLKTNAIEASLSLISTTKPDSIESSLPVILVKERKDSSSSLDDSETDSSVELIEATLRPLPSLGKFY